MTGGEFYLGSWGRTVVILSSVQGAENCRNLRDNSESEQRHITGERPDSVASRPWQPPERCTWCPGLHSHGMRSRGSSLKGSHACLFMQDCGSTAVSGLSSDLRLRVSLLCGAVGALQLQ